VAAFDEVPGVFTRMAVIAPPNDVPPVMLASRKNASWASHE
jgi:hypothetical protein